MMSKLELLLEWLVILAFWTCPSASTGCDYHYLLQPPSELPCNPYQFLDSAETHVYSVSLECTIAQLRNEGDIKSEIRWIQDVDDSEPHTVTIEGPFINSTSTKSMIGDYVLLHSVLNITELARPNRVHTYWCELYTPGKQGDNTGMRVANRATVLGPELYASLPPCPRDTAFHLAQSVCISNLNASLSDVPSITTGSGRCNSEGPAVSAGVIAAIVFGSVTVILAVVVVSVSIIWCVLLRGKRRRGKKQSQHKVESGSTVEPTNGLEAQTPTTTSTNTSPDNGSVRVSSEENREAHIPSPVVPQKPCILPPTHAQMLKAPISARKRAASLLKQLQKPRRSGPAIRAKAPAVIGVAESNGTVRKQGSPQRKKPYKSLELNTVDRPHLYVKRAANSPLEVRGMRPLPVHVLLQDQPRTESRTRLLSETMSNGYVLPSEVEDMEQSMYTEIEPHTRDYLALYTVPRQHSPFTANGLQPIYEEPVTK